VFSQIEAELLSTIQQRDNFKKTAAYLDQQLRETAAKLGGLEEVHKKDQ